MSISSENTRSQMHKGFVEYCVLLIIARKTSYVSDILGALRQAQLVVVEGTLYPLLTRLKNNGILTYQWQESVQGPPRKYYELTEEGRHYLSDLEAAWIEISQTVQTIRNIQQ